jgi:hypothetical protein
MGLLLEELILSPDMICQSLSHTLLAMEFLGMMLHWVGYTNFAVFRKILIPTARLAVPGI